MDDDSYEGLFKPIIDKIMANYQPDAIVLQSGRLVQHTAAVFIDLLFIHA